MQRKLNNNIIEILYIQRQHEPYQIFNRKVRYYTTHTENCENVLHGNENIPSNNVWKIYEQLGINILYISSR